MNRIMLLEALTAFTVEETKDLLLPTSIQRVDEEQIFRPPDHFLMRLPDGKSATKFAPYVLHQFVTGHDVQLAGQQPESSATVRTIICVYSKDEQEGGLALLNVAERIRIPLLAKRLIGDRQFELDMEQRLEFLAYPDDTAPYYAGEMFSVWKIPPVKREVPQLIW